MPCLTQNKATAVGSELSHGAERVLEYMDYLAEEELGEPFTISPNGRGSRAGGRLTLAEFLLHNRKRGSENSPMAYRHRLKVPSDPTILGIKELVYRVLTAGFDIAPKKSARFEHVKQIEPAKLFPSSPQLDYFEILAKRGSRIGALRARKTPLTDAQNRLVKLGEDAVEAVHELRYEQNEKYRIKALNKALNFKVATRPYTIRTFGRTFNRLDIFKTSRIQPGALADLAIADKNYVNSNDSTQSHAKAIRATRIARIVLTCQRTLKL